MPVDLNIIESVTELDTTVVTVVLESASEPGPAGPGVPAGGTAGQVLTKDSGTDYDTSWQDSAGGPGGGAPTDADYLVGTANGDLSNEIVVGTSPGGELGGTWASPTVDATHSGSSHASVQAAAEATAAAALSAHDSDTTGIHGIPDTSALLDTGDIGSTVPAIATFNDHSARHENGGADEISIAGLDGTPTELTNHLNDTSAAHAASAISADSTTLVGTGTDVQAVLEELDNSIADHLADTSDAHDASAISIADAGNDFTATDVEGALAELQADHETDAQNLTDHINDASAAHAASAISVSSTTLSGTGTDVQAVFEEIDNLLDDHSSRHENGGADEISVAGLSGELADAQPLDVRKNSTGSVFTRSRLNFIEGSNVTLTVADDAGNDEVDITIAASGSGSGAMSFIPTFFAGGGL